jgi:selenocysteine lyase/cysteine desulfurase
MQNELVYLDNAATSWPKPACVARAMVEFLETSAGNPGRGGHTLARAASATIEAAREAIANLIHAECAARVVLTHGCTDSVNLAIHGIFRGAMCSGCSGKPHVVSSALEHNAVLRTLHCYEQAGLIELTIVPCGADGLIDPQSFLAACHERTVLACLSHASNVLGTIQAVGRVGAGLRGRSPRALFLVDAAQTAGHINIDVQADCIDLLAIAGHKGLLGPTGTGALYVGCRAYPDDCSQPHLFCERRGGTGAMAPGLDMPTALPDALEAGTMNAVGFAGLVAAMRELTTLDHAREHRHVEHLLGVLSETPGVTLYGLRTVTGRTPSIAFNVGQQSARAVAAALDQRFGVGVRGGVHCAPMLHAIIGTGERGAVRVSPSCFNSDRDIERFSQAIASVANDG